MTGMTDNLHNAYDSVENVLTYAFLPNAIDMAVYIGLSVKI